MKIALVAPTYLPARRANTLQVMKMAEALTGLGQEARLAVPGDPPSGELPWEELARHYGLKGRFSLEWLPAAPRLRRYDYAVKAVFWARRWGAELLYTRLLPAAALASMAGLPTILEVHDLPQGRLGAFFFRRFRSGRGARRLVAITRALLEDLAKVFRFSPSPPFAIVAPDGVDLERYARLPGCEQARVALLDSEQAGEAGFEGVISPACFTAGYTGHFYAGRGLELILAAAARLPEIAFLLAGGEPHDVARLRETVRARRLRNVVLTGFVPNAELPRYQAACEALLMPYQRRVAASSGGDIARYLSPMKVFEYLACGRAILSSDLPALREVLTPQNAVLLPPDDEDAWVNALQELRDRPEHRVALSEQARADARKYSWEARAACILAGLPERPRRPARGGS